MSRKIMLMLCLAISSQFKMFNNCNDANKLTSFFFSDPDNSSEEHCAGLISKNQFVIINNYLECCNQFLSPRHSFAHHVSEKKKEKKKCKHKSTMSRLTYRKGRLYFSLGFKVFLQTSTVPDMAWFRVYY